MGIAPSEIESYVDEDEKYDVYYEDEIDENKVDDKSPIEKWKDVSTRLSALYGLLNKFGIHGFSSSADELEAHKTRIRHYFELFDRSKTEVQALSKLLEQETPNMQKVCAEEVEKISNYMEYCEKLLNKLQATIKSIQTLENVVNEHNPERQKKARKD